MLFISTVEVYLICRHLHKLSHRSLRKKWRRTSTERNGAGSPQEVTSFKKIILHINFIPSIKYNIRYNFIDMMLSVKTFQTFINVHLAYIQWMPNVFEEFS